MLYVFVEGPDDENFIKRYFTLNGYDSDSYRLIPYAQKNQKYINGYIKSINSMPDSEYILLADADKKPTNKKSSPKIELDEKIL